ncbi:UBX domain-containing protein 6-like [Ornithodoros turicata]|uniref:UBX domain-containing protein 6-like n=1 Tax=Ornithodoros turicata TaxID=34597 RepID=UPI003138869E
MSAIRDFFKKRKADSKFKQAGPGHRLSVEEAEAQRRLETSSRYVPAARSGPSEGSQRAGAAALARLEQHQHSKAQSSRALASIRAQARKELEEEQRAAQPAGGQRGPTEVKLDYAPQLGVTGVYFHCPMVGPEVLPYEEVAAKIREFLYQQLSEEQGLTSCLIIHTCNSPREKVKVCVDTLVKCLSNVLEHPDEEKYRRLRLSNKVMQQKVLPLEGALDFLHAAGFVKMVLPHEEGQDEFLVFPDDGDLALLDVLRDALKNAEPILPVLDRNLRVLLPSQVTTNPQLPDEFFSLSPEEILREHEARKMEVELNTTLRTKAMRQRDEMRELRIYKYTLIRIRLPNGILIQGTFNVHEKLQAVRDFLAEHLEELSAPFELLSDTGHKLTDWEASLLDLRLVPAVTLTATWYGAVSPNHQYLRPEVLALVQST